MNMRTNLAPILANLYLAMLQQELKQRCIHDKNLKGLILFQRFGGLGIMEVQKRCRILENSIEWFKKNNNNQ